MVDDHRHRLQQQGRGWHEPPRCGRLVEPGVLFLGYRGQLDGFLHSWGATASATFSVAAPTLPVFSGQTAAGFFDPANPSHLDAQAQLTATASPPGTSAGTLSWIQVVGTAKISRSGPGVPTVNCSPAGPAPWLDASNPYPYYPGLGSTIQFTDVPKENLAADQQSGFTAATYQASFTVTLMWQPIVASGSSQVP